MAYTSLIFIFFSFCVKSVTLAFIGDGAIKKLSHTIEQQLANCCNVQLQGNTIKLTQPTSKINSNFYTDFTKAISDSVREISNRQYKKDAKNYDAKKSDFCFRGQKNSAWKLNSALERSDLADKTSYLLAQFIPHAQILDHLDSISQLSYLQHYGVETPLLDWTKDIDIALHYALKDFKTSRSEASIFILDPYSLGDRYRITAEHGIGVSGLTLSDNIDAVIRAAYFFCHSEFQLFCYEHVKRAAENDGLKMKWNAARKRIDYFDKRSCRYINHNKMKERLSGPIAIVPKWTKGNDRVIALKSIFSLSGIPSTQNSHLMYADHSLKIDFDIDCTEALFEFAVKNRRCLWDKIKELEYSNEDRDFKKRKEHFDDSYNF